MDTLIFATLRKADGWDEYNDATSPPWVEVENSRLFLGWDEYNDATFSPWVEVVDCIPLTVHGKTYADRKSNARNIAEYVQRADVGGMSWGEVALLAGYFRLLGKRYGLTKEFEENGVI